MKKQTLYWIGGAALAYWYFFMRSSDASLATQASLAMQSGTGMPEVNGISGAKMPFNVPLKAGMGGLRGGNPTVTVTLPGGTQCLIPWSDISPSATFDYNGVKYWMQQKSNGAYFALRL
jgi:hypothetical protein